MNEYKLGAPSILKTLSERLRMLTISVFNKNKYPPGTEYSAFYILEIGKEAIFPLSFPTTSFHSQKAVPTVSFRL